MGAGSGAAVRMRRWGVALVMTVGLVTSGLLALPAASASASATWSGTTAPLAGLSPSDYSANPNVLLASVSCPAAGDCVAVGSYQGSSGGEQGMVESLAGATWSASTIPSGSLSASATNPAVTPVAVACPGSGDCVAVGNYSNASGYSEGFVDTLANGTWTSAVAPVPATASGNPEVKLVSVSCPVPGTCYAIGTYYDISLGGLEGLIETLSNGTWSASTAPLTGLSPSARSNPAVDLLALSCPVSGTCYAVGHYTDSSTSPGRDALIETLSNGTWSASTAPLTGLSPAASAVSVDSDLGTISCPVSGTCYAVGTYEDSGSNFQGLVETLSGGTWSAETAPLANLYPGAGSSPSVEFDSISCPVSGICYAAGSYNSSSGATEGLIETLSNGTWSASTAPAAADASATQPNVHLDAVSCPASDSCISAGNYFDSSGNQQGLIEALQGGTWVASPAPLGTLNPSAASDPAAVLDAVTCAAVLSCVAVGNYDDNSGLRQGLIESGPAQVLTTCTWTDGGHSTNDNWSNPSNWSGSGCTGNGGPPSGSQLVFPPSTRNGGLSANDDASGTQFDSLVIEGGYTLSGNGVTLSPVSGTGMSVSGGNTVMIETPITLGEDQEFASTNTVVDLTGAIGDSGSARALTLAGYGWNLEGSDPYSGGTLLAGNAYVNLYRDSGLGTGPVTVDSGSELVPVSGVSVANPVTVSGSGYGGGGGLSTFFDGSATFSGQITLAGDSMVKAPGPSSSLSLTGGVSGPHSLTVNQSGTGWGKVALSSASTYTGGTTVAGGVLEVGASGGLGTGVVTVDSGGTVQLSGGSSLGNALTLDGGTGASNGALEALSGSDEWSGQITMNAAATVAADSSTATLLLDGGISGIGPLTVAAPAGGAGGVVALQAGDSYTQGTVVSPNGTLLAMFSSALSTGSVIVENGGVLQIRGFLRLNNPISLSGSGIGGTGSLKWSQNNLTLNSPLALGASALASDPSNDGTILTLAGGVTGTGTLSTSGAAVLPAGQSAANGGGVSTMSGSLRIDGSVTGQVVSSGGVVLGTGSSGGVDIGCDSALSPGDATPGVFTSSAGVAFACTGAPVSFNVRIDGTSAGSGYSQAVLSSGSLQLGGVGLGVSFGGGFTSAAGDEFDIVVNHGGSAASGVLTYQGAQLSQGAVFSVGGRELQVSYDGGSSGHDVLLTDVTPIPTSTAVSAAPAAASYGSPVTFSATVTSSSGVPSGSVRFSIGSLTLCNGSLAGGVASCTASSSPVGVGTVTATYSGAGAYAGSAGTTGLTVAAIPEGKGLTVRAATPDGKGYWLVGADGGVFNFGDAGFYGSSSALHLSGPVKGVAGW